MVKDNDGDYQKNILDYQDDFNKFDFISFFSSSDDKLYSLEPTMIASNATDEEELSVYAKTALSTETYNKYKIENGLHNKIKYLEEWYGTGSKKVDSAMRIFESSAKINYPIFLQEALHFE